MKLKEKLANQFVEEDAQKTDHHDDYKDCYIAGFEKALEMAQKEAERISPWYAVCCRVRGDNIANNIKELGEEEV